MRENISGHTFEFFWEDGTNRQLNESSREALRGAIRQKLVRGKLDQWDDGEMNTCDWKDLNKVFTDSDMGMAAFSTWMHGR